MQHKQETDKVAMLSTPYMVVPKPVPLTEDYEIQRTRKILTIILAVCLGLSVPLLAAALFESELIDDPKINQRGIKVTSTIIAILLDAFGIFVARTYSTGGLRIFAGLKIFKLIAMGIGITIFLFEIILNSIEISLAAGDTETIGLILGVGAGVFIFIILICSAAFVLSVIIVKLAFKLANVIDANQHSIIQQA